MIKSEYKNYQEYLNHPKFKKVRLFVMEQAGWVCQSCFSSNATEVHHFKYPKWGTFDLPENLIAVCHKCHCKYHGVDD